MSHEPVIALRFGDHPPLPLHLKIGQGLPDWKGDDLRCAVLATDREVMEAVCAIRHRPFERKPQVGGLHIAHESRGAAVLVSVDIEAAEPVYGVGWLARFRFLRWRAPRRYP
jgi:hypothetical protein